VGDIGQGDSPLTTGNGPHQPPEQLYTDEQVAAYLSGHVEEIKVARLQPGDVIVVKTNGASGEDIEYINQSFEYLFPDHRAIVLDGDISMEVVRPGDLVRYEEGPLDWGDNDPCAHRGDPCEKCAKPFPLREIS
jgi:hypothetical protein